MRQGELREEGDTVERGLVDIGTMISWEEFMGRITAVSYGERIVCIFMFSRRSFDV